MTPQTHTLPELRQSGISQPRRQYRLIHAPARELSDADLETAHDSGYLSQALYRQERSRRDRTER